jgi:hypothetical protein
MIEHSLDFFKKNRFFDWYRRFFSIEEIEGSKTLQYSFGVMLFITFLTFFRGWAVNTAITIEAYRTNAYICWPYFQSCGNYFFLQILPQGYSQMVLYAVFFALILMVAYLMYQRAWVPTHMGVSILWLWKFLGVFVLTMSFSQVFNYFDLILLFILLFLPYKLFFMRTGFVFLYFLAATEKLNGGWIIGTYFTSLNMGLPIFGNTSAPLFTNIVICMQVVGSWFLLSKRMVLQRVALWYFLLFHFYSMLIIGYRFPVSVIPILIILFYINTENPPVPLTLKSIIGWLFLGFLLICQSVPFVISNGNASLTGEGIRYQLFMFDANHQCVINFNVYHADGTVKKYHDERDNARYRCEVYNRWFWAQQECARDPSITRISLTFDHSVDGGPFYRIVDVQNVCALDYKPFSHNDWIKVPPQAPVVGYPVKNVYY